MITGLCFRTQFKAMNRNYMVQGYRIAKGAHHNRTNVFHFNLEMKTKPVFAKFAYDKPNRNECPEHCSDQELVVVPFRYVNAAPYQL